MVVLRFLWAFLTSRWLWSLFGLALLGLIVWIFGRLVAIGTAHPFASEIVRFGIVIGFVLVWLIWLVFWLIAMLCLVGLILAAVKAYQGKKFKLPIIGNIAEKIVEK